MSNFSASTSDYYLDLLNGFDALLIAANAEHQITFVNALAHQLLGEDVAIFLAFQPQSTFRLVNEAWLPLEASALPLRQVLQGQAIAHWQGFLVAHEPNRQILVTISGKPLPAGGFIVVRPLLSVGQPASPFQSLTQAIDHRLPSRDRFITWLKSALASYQREPSQVMAVCCLDVQRLRWINSRQGYTTGDQLLAALSDRLMQQAQPGDVVACIGGGQFALFLKETDAAPPILTRCQHLLNAVGVPFALPEQSINITVNLGVALISADYQHAEDWLQDAMTAMHQAKSLMVSYHLFNSDLKAERDHKLQVGAWLEEALQQNQFCLYYQAIVAVHDQKLTGFEALLRWFHPEKGLLLPADFIAIAEETSLIIPIGWWVLREACRQMEAWAQVLPACRELRLSVNMSSKQFSQPDLLPQIQALLHETGFPAQQLTLELTESVLIENSESIVTTLRSLREMGIKLSIDDFGTGYSSLGYLHQFPFDILKIDRSFLENFDEDYEKLGILQSVVRLAWNLGLDVVAEGVETTKHYAQVKALHCESGQGYLFAHPLPPEEAQNFISSKLS